VIAAPAYLYCYYRVAPAKATAARSVVALLFRAVEERFGVAGRLFQGEREPWLWMEVYEHAQEPDRLEALLSEVCAEHGFSACLDRGSERRLERFVAATASSP